MTPEQLDFTDWKNLQTYDFGDRLKATDNLTAAQFAKLPFDDVVKAALAWRGRWYAGHDLRHFALEEAEKERTRRIMEASKNQRRIDQMAQLVTEARSALCDAEQRAARGAEVEARLNQQLQFWTSRLLWAEREKEQEREACELSGVRSFRYELHREEVDRLKLLVATLQRIVNAPMPVGEAQP